MRPLEVCAGESCELYCVSTRAEADGSIYQLDASCEYPPSGKLGMVRAPDGQLLPQEIERKRLRHENELEMTRLDPGRVADHMRRHSAERPCAGCSSLVEARYLRSVDGRDYCPDCSPEGAVRG